MLFLKLLSFAEICYASVGFLVSFLFWKYILLASLLWDRVRQFLPKRKKIVFCLFVCLFFFFFHGFLRLEQTVSSSFFRWNSEETQKRGERVFPLLIHLRFLILFFIYGTKLLNYTEISFQDMLHNNLYEPLGTYISCWIVISSFQH